MTTDALWTATHTALCNKEWSKGRALLDDLGQRPDVQDALCTAAGYGVPGYLLDVIQDRIDQVNRHLFL